MNDFFVTFASFLLFKKVNLPSIRRELTVMNVVIVVLHLRLPEKKINMKRIIWLKNPNGSDSKKWPLCNWYVLQVNLCQKILFLHQLTHNRATDCSLNYQFSTWKSQAQNMRGTCCAHKLLIVLTFRTTYVNNMFSPSSPIFSPCSEIGIFM